MSFFIKKAFYANELLCNLIIKNKTENKIKRIY